MQTAFPSPVTTSQAFSPPPVTQEASAARTTTTTTVTSLSSSWSSHHIENIPSEAPQSPIHERTVKNERGLLLLGCLSGKAQQLNEPPYTQNKTLTEIWNDQQHSLTDNLENLKSASTKTQAIKQDLKDIKIMTAQLKKELAVKTPVEMIDLQSINTTLTKLVEHCAPLLTKTANAPAKGDTHHLHQTLTQLTEVEQKLSQYIHAKGNFIETTPQTEKTLFNDCKTYLKTLEKLIDSKEKYFIKLHEQFNTTETALQECAHQLDSLHTRAQKNLDAVSLFDRFAATQSAPHSPVQETEHETPNPFATGEPPQWTDAPQGATGGLPAPTTSAELPLRPEGEQAKRTPPLPPKENRSQQHTPAPVLKDGTTIPFDTVIPPPSKQEPLISGYGRTESAQPLPPLQGLPPLDETNAAHSNPQSTGSEPPTEGFIHKEPTQLKLKTQPPQLEKTEEYIAKSFRFAKTKDAPPTASNL